MSKPEVLVMAPYPQWDMEALESRFTLHRFWEVEDEAAFFASDATGIRAIATRGDTGAKAELMDRLPALEVISCYGVGVDAIDLDHARAKGIRVTNTPDVLTDDVADMGVALILSAARRIPQGDAYVRAGKWLEGPMALTTRVSGKRLGVIGMGRIGSAVATRMRAFGMTVGYFNRKPRPEADAAYYDNAPALAEASDFLVVASAGGEGTRNIVDAAVLEALGPDGFLINISRGSTVDQEALIAALQGGRIAGAGLDVFPDEPKVDPRLLTFENVVVQPHHASATTETRKAMGRLVLENLSAHFEGGTLPTPVV